MPQACTLIRTSPAAGVRSSRSTTWKSPPAAGTCTAFDFVAMRPVPSTSASEYRHPERGPLDEGRVAQGVASVLVEAEGQKHRQRAAELPGWRWGGVGEPHRLLRPLAQHRVRTVVEPLHREHLPACADEDAQLHDASDARS